MKSIAICNAKGGVAKTTTAVSLARYLAEKEYDTLFVDLDPQANGSHDLMGSNIGEDIEDSTIDKVIKVFLKDKKNLVVKEAIVEIGEHLHLVPSSVDLEYEKDNAKIRSRTPLKILKNILKPVADIYDFVIFDCPADLSIFVESALDLSDLVIVPSAYDKFGFQAVEQVISVICDIQGDDTDRYRVLHTMYDARATKIQESLTEYSKIIDDLGVGLPFKIPSDQNVKNSQAQGKSLMTDTKYRNSRARLNYRKLGEYVLERLS